ncbi:hypothetical protein D3C84_487660 [compost metagenome]
MFSFVALSIQLIVNELDGGVSIEATLVKFIFDGGIIKLGGVTFVTPLIYTSMFRYGACDVLTVKASALFLFKPLASSQLSGIPSLSVSNGAGAP